jgi:hypothetical protein
MVVNYSVQGSAFRADAPQAWSKEPIESRPGQRWFDLHPLEERFVVSAADSSDGAPPLNTIVVVTNVFEELRRLDAATR